MPWQECSKMDERLRFVARLKEGERMAELCREFDISRKTGYKIYQRYKRCGLEGLSDRSRRPYRQANRLPEQIESLIVQVRLKHPTWGAPKIREKLKRQNLGISLPAISTVHAVLDRHGLVSRGGRRARSYKAEGTALSRPSQPNALWCADYKGEFMLADRRYCYPLTLTDFASRYLLLRIPVHAGRPFRSMPGHDSGPCRATIPVHAGPVFRRMPGHHSGACRQGE